MVLGGNVTEAFSQNLRFFSESAQLADMPAQALGDITFSQFQMAITNFAHFLTAVLGAQVRAGLESLTQAMLSHIYLISNLNAEAKAYAGGFIGIATKVISPTLKDWDKKGKAFAMDGSAQSLNRTRLFSDLQLSSIESSPAGASRVVSLKLLFQSLSNLKEDQGVNTLELTEADLRGYGLMPTYNVPPPQVEKKQSGKEPCNNWAKGNCRFGTNCRNIHDPKLKGSKPVYKPSPRRDRSPDRRHDYSPRRRHRSRSRSPARRNTEINNYGDLQHEFDAYTKRHRGTPASFKISMERGHRDLTDNQIEFFLRTPRVKSFVRGLKDRKNYKRSFSDAIK